ncbi:MAG: alpha/beta hydrolase [Ignavibacteriales bacterium]|nr:alpha/beta hydrolase [Ignavibacteriales bacterium]
MKLSNNLLIVEWGDKKKLPVIFVHGFPYDHQMWQNQLKHLENSFYCVSYDIRGLGESLPGDKEFIMELLVDDLFKIIKELNLDKPVICGHSMGGYICLRAIERDQSSFRGLILCDTKSTADDETVKQKRLNGIKQIDVEGVEKFCEDTVPNTFADTTLAEDREVYDEVLARAKRSNPVGVKGSLMAMLSRTDTTPFLEKIIIPTLLLCGAFDKLTPPPVMREMHKEIKDSEFAIAPRAGHMSPVENPDFVNDVIEGFLKRRII